MGKIKSEAPTERYHAFFLFMDKVKSVNAVLEPLLPVISIGGEAAWFHHQFQKIDSLALDFTRLEADVIIFRNEFRGNAERFDNSVLELRKELKKDIADSAKKLRKELKGYVAFNVEKLRNEIKGDIDKLRNEIKGDIDKLRNEIKGDIEKLRNELKGDIAKLGTQLDHILRFLLQLSPKNIPGPGKD
jgi:gas vesicle protein